MKDKLIDIIKQKGNCVGLRCKYCPLDNDCYKDLKGIDYGMLDSNAKNYEVAITMYEKEYGLDSLVEDMI